MGYTVWNEEDINKLRELYSCMSNKELVSIFNNKYKLESIKWKARSLGLYKTYNCYANNKKYSINEEFFKIQSNEMYYVLGFWCADGCITSSGGNKCFNIHINQKDAYILQEILKVMKSDHLIYNGANDSVSINICNSSLYDSLINLGFTERKSLSLIFPIIPEIYQCHFIRGYFDGDGCISSDGRFISIIGTKEFLTSLSIILAKNNIVIHSIDKLKCNDERNNAPHRLTITKQLEVYNFGKYIYRGLHSELYLKRKFDRFNDLANRLGFALEFLLIKRLGSYACK